MHTDTNDDAMGAAILVMFATILLGSIIILIVLFVSAMIGLIDQLADPHSESSINPTIIGAIFFSTALIAYLALPELSDERRRKVTFIAALTGTVIGAAATNALAPALARPSPFVFVATGFVLVASVSLLPAIAICRAFVLFDRDSTVAAAGDHYLDIDRLDPATRRLIEKHAPNLRTPRGWRPPALFGARDALTYSDLNRALALEAEEAQQVRDLHTAHVALAAQEREASYHAFILSLSSADRALFEATLRANVEAVQGIAAFKDECARDAARLTAENDTLRAAIDDHAHDHTVSERTQIAQAHELAWLWSERDRLLATHHHTGDDA